ncbi:hypothetical protein C2S53_006244 [Perilla frutescens var. hirtella]|uniref:Uncharacterized protein n=1 Tax=Perilla frutescens var. hirtella TaxID=608512 RepID=A0AAD4ITQ7_PERFH|nr:hypothetical protein C2S53_006244 [Perilla frutescens var. hirtella]
MNLYHQWRVELRGSHGIRRRWWRGKMRQRRCSNLLERTRSHSPSPSAIKTSPNSSATTSKSPMSSSLASLPPTAEVNLVLLFRDKGRLERERG